ncbi:hypothetical protein HYU23_01900 [Candidatus Woesearchaeota archaeon]|nr:hypothetical protein [Candidatus Woesearchaeota archaeon]
MKKEAIILIVLSLFLTSCATFGGFGNYFSKGSGELGGRGLMLRFLEPKGSSINIPEGVPFSVKIQLENYVVSDFGISGQICLRDTVTDNFGGIHGTQCLDMNLQPARKTDSRITPFITDPPYFFGPYSYKGAIRELPSVTETNKIIADVKYEIDTTAESTMCIKSSAAQSVPSECKDTQNLRIDQPDLPLKVSSINARTFSLSSTDTSVLLEITLIKSEIGHFTTKTGVASMTMQPGSALVSFDVLINNNRASCTGLVNNMLEINKDTDQKIIKCSAKLIVDQNYIRDAPIKIKMGYGFIKSVDGPKIMIVKEEVIV